MDTDPGRRLCHVCYVKGKDVMVPMVEKVGHATHVLKSPACSIQTHMEIVFLFLLPVSLELSPYWHIVSRVPLNN